MTSVPLIGKRVAIFGIVARPELNGRVGRALSYDANCERYAVELEIGGEQILLRPTVLTEALPNQRDISFEGMDVSLEAAKEQASSGFPNASRLMRAAERAGQPMGSFEGPLGNGLRHLASFVRDPSNTVIGTLNTLDLGPAAGLVPPECPSPLRSFVHGQFVADEENAGAQADWNSVKIDWGSHQRSTTKAIGLKKDRVEIILDRPLAPRIITIRGGDFQVSFLLSSATVDLSSAAAWERELWTSDAHCREAFWGLTMKEQSKVKAPRTTALSDKDQKKCIRLLTSTALLQAVQEQKAAESWALAVFIANTSAQKRVETGAAAYGLLADLALAIAHGAHTARWAHIMCKHGECLEAMGSFRDAVKVYAELSAAAERKPEIVGGPSHVSRSIANQGLASKRAGDYTLAESTYRHALHWIDSSEKHRSASEQRYERNVVLELLGKLYLDSSEESKSGKLAGAQKAKMAAILSEIFEFQLAELDLMGPAKSKEAATRILCWDRGPRGQVPTLKVPSLGRTWHMHHGKVVEEERQQPERVDAAVRRGLDQFNSTSHEHRSPEETSLECLPKPTGVVMSQCALCGTTRGERMQQCARCRIETYCSKECQMQAWPQHKQACQKVKKP